MGKLIMVVDDSASVRQVVGVALKGAGYEVLEANDGKDALAKLTGQKVNMIISDVNMPNMDGITLVKEVKKLREYRFTPILMLTTERKDTAKQEGKAAGARGWVTKPFQPTVLLDAVAKLVLP